MPRHDDVDITSRRNQRCCQRRIYPRPEYRAKAQILQGYLTNFDRLDIVERFTKKCDSRLGNFDEERWRRWDARTSGRGISIYLGTTLRPRSCAPIPIPPPRLLSRDTRNRVICRVTVGVSLLHRSVGARPPSQAPHIDKSLWPIYTCVLAREYWYHCQDSMGRTSVWTIQILAPSIIN